MLTDDIKDLFVKFKGLTVAFTTLLETFFLEILVSKNYTVKSA